MNWIKKVLLGHTLDDLLSDLRNKINHLEKLIANKGMEIKSNFEHTASLHELNDKVKEEVTKASKVRDNIKQLIED
ncbi:MAG: hypothetical protein IE937_05675 [Gammaproteobacteria bacterium]|nr:hypothetical protein [Gammaproteobacteria bacterium]